MRKSQAPSNKAQSASKEVPSTPEKCFQELEEQLLQFKEQLRQLQHRIVDLEEVLLREGESDDSDFVDTDDVEDEIPLSRSFTSFGKSFLKPTDK